MKRTLRLLKDADVDGILEEVNLSCSCDSATLKNDINELVAPFTRPRRSTTEAIEIIDDILGALEQLRNVFELHSRSELLLPTTTLDDALRDLFFSNLPVTARSPKHPMLRGSERTFGDQLAQLIDYYAALRTGWETLKKGKHRAGPAHDMIVLGLRVVFQQRFNRNPTCTREGPFCRFIAAVMTHCGRRMEVDGAYKLLREVLARKAAFAGVKAPDA